MTEGDELALRADTEEVDPARAFSAQDHAAGRGIRRCGWPWMGVGLIVLSSLVGFGLVAVATTNGVGLSIDSAFYIGVANELAAGHGLTVPWGTPEPTPMGTRWAPLMTAVLAAIAQFGPDPVDALRWVNALCLVGTALVCGAAIRKATGSIALSVAVALLLVTSQTMLGVHAMAWSEPIFIFFATLALVLLATHLRTRRRIVLVAALVAASAAFLTRYAGGSLGLAAFACLLIQPGRWRFRITAASCTALMAMLPMTPGGPTWISWMRVHLGGTTDDAIGGPVLQVLRIDMGLEVIRNWLWPWGLDAFSPRGTTLRLVLAMLLFAALLFVTVYSWAAIFRRSTARGAKERGSSTASDETRSDSENPAGAELGAVLGLFIAAYFIFILAAVALLGRYVNFAPRIMLPLMPAGVMLLALGGNMLRRRFARSRGFGWAGAAVCTLVLAVRVAGALDYCSFLATGYGVGAQGYHHQSWHASPTIAALRGLPENATLYSNAPDAVYLLTGRNALWLSFLTQSGDGPAPHPQSLVHSPGTTSDAFIVYFDRLAWRRSPPSKSELAAHWPLQTVTTTDDGEIFSITKALTWIETPE